MLEWSIRGLLNPVIARLLIYGVNPIDLEYVLGVVERKKHLNVRSLEKSWMEEWERKAAKYTGMAEEAEVKGNAITAQKLYFYAAQCYYAVFLINLSETGEKQRVYSCYSSLYQKSIRHGSWRVERLDIAIDAQNAIPGYLHLPNGTGATPYSCVVIYSGLGSCKEEMHTLAEPLVQRGLAVFTPDMPGNGEALMLRDIKCRIGNLNAVFQGILNTLEQRDDIRRGAFGAYGLCMGGGYAYRAACLDARYAACTAFFPLRITQVAPGTTPQWMKQGAWYDYQTGALPAEQFMAEMRELEEGAVSCPFLFIHGKNDNWMTLGTAMEMYQRASAAKEKIIIEAEPVFSNQQLVTHTMPVGEQLHWLRHVAADWMVARLEAASSGKE